MLLGVLILIGTRLFLPLFPVDVSVDHGSTPKLTSQQGPDKPD
jgi:hypothetical protein